MPNISGLDAQPHLAQVGVPKDEHVTLLVGGDLDLARGTDTDVRVLLPKTSPQRVTIDLQHITVIDAAGIGFLVKLRGRADQLGITMELVNVAANVRRVLTVSGVAGHLGIPDPRD